MAPSWKSLFLPIGEDRVIYSSFFTPLGSSLSELNPLHVVNDPDTQRQALLCVLENQTVVIYDLTSSTEGPRKLTTLPAAKEMKSVEGQSKVAATCASVIPLELLYACRAEEMRPVKKEDYEPPENVSPQATGKLLFRGVVGSSNGRVDVFTESSYAFGFPAHQCPVIHAQALFVGDSAMPPPIPEASPNGVVTKNSDFTMNVIPSNQKSSGGRETFASVHHTLGFLTMGLDGIVVIWRRRSEGYRREKLIEPSFLSRCHAVYAALPSRLFSVENTFLDRERVPTADVDERPPALYSPASPSRPTQPPTTIRVDPFLVPSRSIPSLIFTGGNGFSKTIKVRSCESMKEVEADVELDGTFSRTTAIVVDGSTCLVAREKVVYSVDYCARVCKRVLTSSSSVTHLVSHAPLAVAGCQSGKLYVFNFTTGVVVGSFYTYSGAAVLSLSLAYSAMMLSVVDATKCVEIFELPSEYLRQSVHSLAIREPQYFASAEMLFKSVQLQECAAGTGAAAVSRFVAAEERLLLSKFLVPEETSQYLSKQYQPL